MGDLERWLFVMQSQEAIASVALSHPEDCACKVCRAATGDQEAFADLLMVLNADTGFDMPRFRDG